MTAALTSLAARSASAALAVPVPAVPVPAGTDGSVVLVAPAARDGGGSGG